MIADEMGRIHFMCEIKTSQNESKDAEAQLLSMALPFNSIDAGYVHRSFGATLAGKLVKLFYYEQSKGYAKKTEIAAYHLSRSGYLSEFVKSLVLIGYLISILPESPGLSLVPTQHFDACALQFHNGAVLKLVDVEQLVKIFHFNEANRLQFLVDFYKQLQSEQQRETTGIENAISILSIEPDETHKTLLLCLGPIGHPLGRIETSLIDPHDLIRDVVACLKPLHDRKIVHYDMRAPNIIYFKGHYNVIDFENIREFCRCKDSRPNSLVCCARGCAKILSLIHI